MKIRVGVSNRHIHLCKSDADILFGEGYESFKSPESLTGGLVKVSTDKYEFPYVRVLGPLRDYTQVEVSLDDSKLLGINPPVRDSGDLKDSESVWLEGPNGKIYKENCCIRANRHIHCNKLDNIGHTNGDIVKVLTNGMIMDDVHIKEKDSYVLELHIDKNDAMEFGLNTGDYIDLE